jgi:hypothetical protein
MPSSIHLFTSCKPSRSASFFVCKGRTMIIKSLYSLAWAVRHEHQSPEGPPTMNFFSEDFDCMPLIVRFHLANPFRSGAPGEDKDLRSRISKRQVDITPRKKLLTAPQTMHLPHSRSHANYASQWPSLADKASSERELWEFRLWRARTMSSLPLSLCFLQFGLGACCLLIHLIEVVELPNLF